MKQYIENTGKDTIYVAGRAIQPGEGREVDVPDVGTAEVAAEEPSAEAAADALLRELLAGNVDAVKQSLADLSLDALNRLTELETEAAKPRKGVLEALADARLAAADAKLGSDNLEA